MLKQVWWMAPQGGKPAGFSERQHDIKGMQPASQSGAADA
jgi:hypothetical protein